MNLNNESLASLLALFLLMPAPLHARLQSSESSAIKRPIDKTEMRKRLDDYMERIARFGFSGALLVAAGGEIVFNKGYGMADRDKNIPNTAETVFTTGSITKQFTSAAIVKLEMQGKLKTSDSISKYLDGVPDDKRGVTLHHLLTHTSGMLSTAGGPYEPDRERFVRKILDSPLSFAPGERFRYSNEGYGLLAVIIEKVSGESYERYLRENLFKPAGMNFTGYRLPDWTRKTVAHWYKGEEHNGSPLEKSYPDWSSMGSGAILSTTEDMYRWHIALKGDRLLSPAAKTKLFTPEKRAYAYGWDVVKTPYGTVMAHDGGNTLGVGADVKRFVDSDVFIMSFCNDSGETMLLGDVRHKIKNIVFGETVLMPPRAVSIDAETIAKCAGIYRLPSGSKLIVSAGEGYLTITGRGQDAFNLLAANDRIEREKLSLLNLRASTITGANARGDYAPMQEAFKGIVTMDWLKSRQDERWREWRERFGDYKGFEVIGTVAEGREDHITYARLDFERGAALVMYWWGPLRLAGYGQVSSVPGRLLLPQSSFEFAGFDLSTSTTLKINFKADDKGFIEGLEVQTNGREVRADRSGL